MESHKMNEANSSHKTNYRKLFIMAVLSYISMYALMYLMVDVFGNVILNVVEAYMAGVMTASMFIIEMFLMRNMYKNKKLNAIIITSAVLLFATCFLFIRNQTGVSDKEFMKAMIPYHAAAILMVRQTQLNDPEVQKLAHDTITS